jgi:hypothetical protein
MEKVGFILHLRLGTIIAYGNGTCCIVLFILHLRLGTIIAYGTCCIVLFSASAC